MSRRSAWSVRADGFSRRFYGRSSGRVRRARRDERRGAQWRGAIVDEKDADEPRHAARTAAAKTSCEFAPVAERGEEMNRARDEIAARAQAAAQPRPSDSAKAEARWFVRIVAAGFRFARRYELRRVREDHVAHRAFDFLEADLGAAALALIAATPKREPRKHRQEP